MEREIGGHDERTSLLEICFFRCYAALVSWVTRQPWASGSTRLSKDTGSYDPCAFSTKRIWSKTKSMANADFPISIA